MTDISAILGIVAVSQGVPDPTGTLIQYGALGVIALAAMAAVRVLFTRMTSHLELEISRGDRLEEELRKLNETVRSEYIATIAKAAQAISDANRAVADALAAVRGDSHG